MNIERHKPVTQKRRKPWTMEELRFVELYYGSLLVCEIAEHLGRTSGSVKSMAHRLGCNGTHLHWTDDDKAVLTTHYATGAKMQTVMSMLPGRTWAGIMSMIDRLGIVRRQWQPQECRILEKYYASEGTRVAERLPGRTKSAVANQAHAMKLKHPHGLRWDDDELRLLEQNQHLPVTDLAKLFPRRSRIAVYHHWVKLRKRQFGTRAGREQSV